MSWEWVLLNSYDAQAASHNKDPDSRAAVGGPASQLPMKKYSIYLVGSFSELKKIMHIKGSKLYLTQSMCSINYSGFLKEIERA